ncbi:hypothetical protein GY45DRAFT_186256 [Cubamyces sp. BRFM 1775]|nr:hypothetical protein GY45DRAFT_186256 [Cubamyces sp. BRFM 1775]
MFCTLAAVALETRKYATQSRCCQHVGVSRPHCIYCGPCLPPPPVALTIATPSIILIFLNPAAHGRL